MKKVQGPTVTNNAGTQIEAWWIKEPFAKEINMSMEQTVTCMMDSCVKCEESKSIPMFMQRNSKSMST